MAWPSGHSAVEREREAGRDIERKLQRTSSRGPSVGGYDITLHTSRRLRRVKHSGMNERNLRLAI